MGKITAAITGVGQYLPEYILTNDELSRMVDTNDEWIMSHTGIKTRIGYELVSYLLHYSSVRCVTFKELFVCKK